MEARHAEEEGGTLLSGNCQTKKRKVDLFFVNSYFTDYLLLIIMLSIFQFGKKKGCDLKEQKGVYHTEFAISRVLCDFPVEEDSCF